MYTMLASNQAMHFLDERKVKNTYKQQQACIMQCNAKKSFTGLNVPHRDRRTVQV